MLKKGPKMKFEKTTLKSITKLFLVLLFISSSFIGMAQENSNSNNENNNSSNSENNSNSNNSNNNNSNSENNSNNENNNNPTASCRSITVYLNSLGHATINAHDIDGGSSNDNLSVSHSEFTESHIGNNSVWLRSTRSSNNHSDSCQTTIIVRDTLKPIIHFQNITIQLNASGVATITASQVNDGSTDNCTIASYTLSKTSFNCSNIGANTDTLTVTDAHGNVSKALVTVTVQDNIAPIIHTQNITVQLNGSGAATITASQVNNGSTDNCTIATYSLNKTSFNCSNVGANTDTLIVTDVNGNVSRATATVTVVDNIAPTATAQNVTIYLNASGAASTSATSVNNGSSDNCSIASYSLNKTSFDCSNVGANSVTLTVTDANGNVSTATATVTVVDNIAPTATAQNVTINLNASGAASTTATAVNNGSSDNCSIATLGLSKTSFDCSNVGANTVTLTVTDVNGNISTASATVTVVDNIAPTATAQNATLYLNASGAASTSESAINNGSSDNCSIATLGLSKTSFDCSNVGANTVTLTVTDVNGNISTATATVTVVDNIAPTATAQNATLYLNASGAASTSATAVNNGSSDNCSIASLGLSKTSFDCSNVGVNTVTLTVTDASGNVSTASATVTIIDTIKPTVITQNITANLGSNVSVTITPAQVNNGSFDNCSITTYSLSPNTFNCTNIGNNTVTLTATDASGNVSSTTAVVNVQGENLAGSDAIIYINESNVVKWSNVPSTTNGQSNAITSTTTFNGTAVNLTSTGGSISTNTCDGIGVTGGQVENGCTNTVDFKNRTINQDQSFKVTLANSNLGIYKLVFASAFTGRVKVTGRRNGNNVISFTKYMVANDFDTFDFTAACALKGICVVDEVKFTLAEDNNGNSHHNWNGRGCGHDDHHYGEYHEGENERDNDDNDYDDGSSCTRNCGFSVKFPIFYVKAKEACGLSTANEFEDDDNKIGNVVALTGPTISVSAYTGNTTGVNSDGTFTTGNPFTSNYAKRILAGYDNSGRPAAWEVSNNCDLRSIRMGKNANKPQLPLGTTSSLYTFTVTSVDVNGQYIFGTRKTISNNTTVTIRWRVTEFFQRAWVLAYEVYTPYSKTNASNEQATAEISNIATVDVYPNPSLDAFNIRMNSTSDKLMNVTILDMTGREIATFSNLSPGEAFVYNAENLKAAVYFVQVSQGGFTKMVKISKMN